MKRSGSLRRATPLKRSPMKRSRPKPVPSDIYAEVAKRDGGCVARRLVPEVPCWGRIDPHHILPRGRGGPDTAENLACLCRAHHDWVHAHPAQGYDLGLLKKSEK